MKSSLAQLLIPLVISAAMASGAAGAEPADSVNLGYGGIVHTMPHCDAKVFSVEYEHLLTPTTAILGRASEAHYRYDNGRYYESGKPWGLDVGARYYPAGGLHGFYMSGTLGYWKAGWSFIQNESGPVAYYGEASSHSLRLNFGIGDRIPIEGTNISIMPEVNLGKFFSSRSCSYSAPASQIGAVCSQKSEVNAYLYVGVVAGFAF